MEWNKIDVNICNTVFFNVFKNGIQEFIRPEPKKNLMLTEELKFLTRIRLRLSH